MLFYTARFGPWRPGSREVETRLAAKGRTGRHTPLPAAEDGLGAGGRPRLRKVRQADHERALLRPAPGGQGRRSGGPFAGEPLPRAGRGCAARSKDRKSTRLNSSHGYISYAVFCLKKKT